MKRRSIFALPLAAAPLMAKAASINTATPETALADIRRLAEGHSGWLMISRQFVDASELLPWCQRMQIDSVAALTRMAEAFSQAVSYSQAQNMTSAAPTLGVLPTIPVGDLHLAMVAKLKLTNVYTLAPGHQAVPTDKVKQLPTEAHLDALLQAFLGALREFKYGYRECEDFAAMFMGWLADQGLGSLAIGTAWLTMSFNGTPYASGHVTLIALCQSGQAYWLEVKDRKRMSLNATTFRGWRGNTEDNFKRADAGKVGLITL